MLPSAMAAGTDAMVTSGNSAGGVCYNWACYGSEECRPS